MKSYILQKDIIIPAGTEFDNYSLQSRIKGSYDGVVGFDNDHSEIISITDDSIFNPELGIFKEK